MRSKRVLTYNSLFALDSLYNGIPSISISNTSLHYQFAKFDLSNINDESVFIDREIMFSKLSYCQWRDDEVKCGKPFEKLLKLL